MQVEAQVGEVLMVDGSRQVAHIVVFVVDGQAVEQYFVVDQCDTVVSEPVSGVERGDGGFTIDGETASQVDGREGTGQS